MPVGLDIIWWPWWLWLGLVTIHTFLLKKIPSNFGGIYTGFRLGLLCAILVELIYVAVGVYL